MTQKKQIFTMPPLPVTAYTSVTSSGTGSAVLYSALMNNTHALHQPKLFEVDFPVWVGEVCSSDLPEIPPGSESYTSRNNQIALAALNAPEDNFLTAVNQAVSRYGCHRVGVIIGTSTSGIYETEQAYRAIKQCGVIPEKYSYKDQHAWSSTARFIAHTLNVSGPCYAISTACSSSTKAIAAAQRLIAVGICDAVVAGGVDSICRTTVYGFSSLGLVAESPCQPLDKNRAGISPGEGAGLVLLEKPQSEHSDCIHLYATGESSDAYHMTAPLPDGEGGALAITSALQQTDIAPSAIDYINLHATGTLKNDASEITGINSVLNQDIPRSGTKGLTGHTLGAAGGVEAVITLLAIERQFLPGTIGLKEKDDSFNCNIVGSPVADIPVQFALTNNFGFGGNNASLLFGRPQ